VLKLTITINGKPCVCEPGEYILDIAARNGITIPTLCHHEGLPGQGCCRVCVVEVDTDGWCSIVTACVYPVERECAVFTDNERVARQRGMVLSLLRSLAPESCKIAELCEAYSAPVYDRFIEKAGEDACMCADGDADGDAGGNADRDANRGANGDAGVRAGGKCVLCGLCTRACQSLGTGAIATVNRGINKTVTTPYDEFSIVCVGCASCAAVCPTGAIAVNESDGKRTIWNKTLPVMSCEKCGKPTGTFVELRRTGEKAESEIPNLCDECKKKNIAEVLAATYGS